MSSEFCAALASSLRPHFDLSKSRLETLCVLIIGIANGRTVNLSHLAAQFPGAAKHASNYRRLQRFFQHVRFDQGVIAHIIIRMLNLSRRKCLALDRTNWKFGSKDINILVLAIVTRRFRVPILWTLLDHRGNSNTDQRIALMKRYLALFGAGSIELLLADREFIGARWMDFLNKNNVPFAIRIKSDMRVTLCEGGTWSFRTLLRGRRLRTVIRTWRGSLPDTQSATILQFAARKIKGGEWLIIASNAPDPKQALRDYRKRWAIENLFADAKTRGLNFEDTHMKNPDKISVLLALSALTMMWAYRCATHVMGIKAVKRKSHKRREKSWFRIGLDALRNAIINHKKYAINAWIKTCPKRPIIQ